MAALRGEVAFLAGGDAALLVFSLWAALALRNLALPPLGYFEKHLILFVPVFLLSLVIFYIAGLYEKPTRLVKSIMGTRIAGAQIANILIASVFFFIVPVSIAPKTILLLYLIVSVPFISVWRFYLAPLITPLVRRPAVIIGSGPSVQEVMEEVNENNRYSIRFANSIGTENGAARIASLLSTALRAGVRMVVLDTHDRAVRGALAALENLIPTGITVVEFSSLYEDIFDRVPLAHIDDTWLVEHLPKRHAPYDLAKRVFDILLAALGSVIALPLILLAALVLFVEGGSSPLIFHERIGTGGRVFRMVKLRTMLVNDHGDPELQKRNRVTSVGKFLRKTRIDELPQLWNILDGHLSFIGPRPELPKIAAVYRREIPYYDARHFIAPGLSGWAQIYDYDPPRGAADVERTRRKLSYDLYYLARRSFGLDLAITLKTLRALASFSGS